ncbi:hypothetical protein [Nitrospirillum sp. BR 11828]|uniref:hypothetical protein n=1 Tax=Nitrospirillum sp. BR 11828 TaxID=3104325 RepID=UPI002ACA4DF5|nr:hypothetical protein [Nitrospirillum sp. BR 11828]MDZ5647168.1 hypothetical protein [Nitrospirillum sp. BR 11828]
MLQIDVSSSIDQAVSLLRAFDPEQLPYAVALALTNTAKDAQEAVRASMPAHFTLRRDWVVQGIRIVPATKQLPVAMVYSRDQFMALQETGGLKIPHGKHIAIPLPAVRPTPTALIAKDDLPRNILPTLRAKGGGLTAVVTMKNGHKFIARLRNGAGKGNRLDLLYYLVDDATLKPRLGLEDITRKVVDRRFVQHLDAALTQAMRTARR